MSEAKEEKKEGEGEEAKPKSKKKLFIIIGVVVLLLCAGVPFALMGGGDKDKKEGEHGEEKKEAEHPKHLATWELDPFIVNLSENASFLKVKLLLEYDPEVIINAEKAAAEGGEGHGGGGSGGESAKAGPPEALSKRLPMIRDAIIRILSAKKPAEVLSLDGKEKLKEEILDAVNEAIGLEEPPVSAVYFADFIVQ